MHTACGQGLDPVVDGEGPVSDDVLGVEGGVLGVGISGDAVDRWNLLDCLRVSDKKYVSAAHSDWNDMSPLDDSLFICKRVINQDALSSSTLRAARAWTPLWKLKALFLV